MTTTTLIYIHNLLKEEVEKRREKFAIIRDLEGETYENELEEKLLLEHSELQQAIEALEQFEQQQWNMQN